MLTYTTQHCPLCNAVYVKATGEQYFSKDNSRYLNDFPFNHPTCSCDVYYADFSQPIPVPPNILIVWKESKL